MLYTKQRDLLYHRVMVAKLDKIQMFLAELKRLQMNRYHLTKNHAIFPLLTKMIRRSKQL